MWNIERQGPFNWRWEVGFSSHGYAMGWTYTKRGAKKQLREAQEWLLVETTRSEDAERPKGHTGACVDA